MKRYLTKHEIEYVLSFIQPQAGIPIDTAMSVVKLNKKLIRDQLKSQQIYPAILDSLKNMIEKQYMDAKIQAGESVGVIGAQSIGEKQTQTTLNTFHTAGSGDKMITTGVPRIEELLNATRDPKSTNCIVYMKNKHESIASMRKTIGYNLVEMTFSKISKSYEIIINKPPEKWYNTYKMLYNDNFTRYTDCISIKIDMDILYEYNLDMETLTNLISGEYSDMICIFSPDSIGQIDVFCDTSNIDLPENRQAFINEDNAVQIYLEEVVQPILYKIVISGISGIKNIYFNDDENSFETDGSNFKQILCLPFVDTTKTISNNIWDIYDTLGVEASVNFLINEFMTIMEGINRCHIQLLAEKMTHNGSISSISRYTMRSETCGPMGKASFEETMDNFLKAALFGQLEDTRGVSASIICGKIAHIGTGAFDLMIDIEALPNQVDVLSDLVIEKDTLIYNKILPIDTNIDHHQMEMILENKKLDEQSEEMTYLDF